MTVASDMTALYSKRSIYKTAWEEYCRLHPDSGFNKPVKTLDVNYFPYSLVPKSGAN
jgi:hypothetical protein